MMADQIWNEFAALPEDAQMQVAEFIGRLRQSLQATETPQKAKRPALKDEPFVGMWKDRDDLTDSSEWVRQLREKEWTR
jgi:hypothetical protein